MRASIGTFLIVLVVSVTAVGLVAARLDNHETQLPRYTGNESPNLLPNEPGRNAVNALMGGCVFAGGQNGTWFEVGQDPRLYEVSLQDSSYTQLIPVRSGGTVWGGGFNGSQWLVSGWGTDDDSPGPYIWLYDGQHVVTEGSLDDYGQASSWNGGDIFAASYNGNEWLLSGLGSGILPSLSPNASNHMSLGTFNGTGFTDLSSLVPNQQDAILYTNAWNGNYWLIGGGYLEQSNILFTFDGQRFVNLTEQAENAIPTFASVQAVAWNGNYWLIGGVGFLAKYDGHNFTDLTQQLENAVSVNFSSVNAIVWGGSSWMIGGGAPIATLGPSQAWVATYATHGFTNLSSILPSYVAKDTIGSSVLTITDMNGLWIYGGYSNGRGILLAYDGVSVKDYSSLVRGLTYVDWVSSLQTLQFAKPVRLEKPDPQ